MPSHSITVSHDVPYQLLLSGTHGVSAGSVMIFVPSTSTDCTGASGLVASTIPDYGGTVALDANTNQPSVTIRLHGSQPDGTRRARMHCASRNLPSTMVMVKP